MFSRSTWLHLRIPFSYFLLPVFLFALGVSPNFTESRLLWSFLIVHLLLYPASNGFNSYFDKDEKSIGGLSNPPPVKVGLYYVSLLFDGFAIVLGLKISVLFASMLLIYGLVSKAYSHPAVRLKKYPIIGWLITGFFQGCFTFMMCYEGINALGIQSFFSAHVYLPAVLTSVMLWANYPMTQIYQHEEDKKHGDTTMSMRLGIRGTFYFTALLFGLATVGFVVFFYSYYSIKYVLYFLMAMTPVVVYFLFWFLQVYKDEQKANHKKTMWLNFVSATCLNAFFIYFFLDTSQVLQALKGGF